jgi:hypothetical protein
MTYVAAYTIYILGSSIVSVCLRCGWSLGNIQDHYFCFEAAGDQYFGGFCAGLPVNKAEFAPLSLHFAVNDDVLNNNY